MWQRAGTEVGIQVRVEATLEKTKGFAKLETASNEGQDNEEERDMGWRDEGDRLMVFEVWRV